MDASAYISKSPDPNPDLVRVIAKDALNSNLPKEREDVADAYCTSPQPASPS